MKKFLIIGGIAVAAIIIVVVLVLGNLNSIIKKGVETAGPKILQAPVTLNKVDISFLSGGGELTGLTIGNPEGFKTEYAFQLGQVKVDIDTGSIASEKIHVKSISIAAPQIIFEGAFHKNNLSQLQANAETFTGAGEQATATDEKKAKDSSGGKKIQIDHLTIKNGSVSVSMGILQGKKLTVQLPPIELKDIGKDKDASISDALRRVLGAINKAVIPAIQSNLGNLDKKLLKKTGETLQKEVEKGLGAFKGLLGK